MTDKKIIMKINRYIKSIGKDDRILDNGSCIQVITQTSIFKMGKKHFKDLKTRGFIFVDEKRTKKAKELYKTPFLTYYRFDIDRMIENGYEVEEK